MQSQVLSVSDPRLDIRQKLDLVLKGAENISFQQFQPNQISNSSVQITCDPPNRDIGVGRCPLLKAVYNVTMAFTNTSSPAIAPLQNGYWGIRNMPYTSTVSSHQISVNNDIYAVSPVNQYNRALQHYYDDWNERFTVYSTSGSMLDQFQNYADGLASNRNPLQPYSNNSFDQTRNDSLVNGGVIISNVSGNTAGSTSVTFTVTVTEPLLFLSPLSQGKNGYMNNCLFNVDKMTYSATFSNLNRILSVSTTQPTGIAITSVSTSLAQNGISLLFNYFKPNGNDLLKIPQEIDYPYYSLVLYQTGMPSTAPNASQPGNSQNIQLIGVPRKIYLWAAAGDSVYNTDPTSFNTSDVFFALNSLTVTWNTNQYLASATQQDLYNISVKNGNRLSWVQWSSAMGSVLCLDVAEDIGLSASEAVGLNKTVQLAINANFTNKNQSLTITPTMNILVIYDGIFTVKNGFVKREINTLSSAQILSAQRADNIPYAAIRNYYGGSFLDDVISGISSVVSPIIKGVKQVLPIAKQFAPIVKPFLPPNLQAPLTALGLGRRRRGGQASTGGSGYLTRAEMMNNMNEYR